jgi:integrase
MPRILGKLNQRGIATAKPKRGRKARVLADGGNLYLQCTLADDGVTVRRSWVFRFEVNGKRREMGLGPLHTIGLAEARDRARALRVQLVDNIDPLAQREADRRAKLAAEARTVTFQQAAEQYLNLHSGGWGADHHHQWRASLATYAYPTIGKMAVADIDQAAVMRIVEPIWTAKPTTAGRVLNRVERILDFAAAHEYRPNDNPAARVVSALPKKSRIAKVEHHAAVPWQEMPAFMAELRGLQSTTARCLEFLILTGARSDEAIGAQWDEIKNGVWTVPAERMKGKVEHRVPLSKRALDLLNSLPKSGPFVFGGNKPLQETAIRRQVLPKLRPMAPIVPARSGSRVRPRSTVTVHGFRSSFKTWTGECTNFANETSELALAHKIGNKTEQAYEKGDKLAKRARLMQAWCDFLGKPAVTGGIVTPIRKAAG